MIPRFKPAVAELGRRVATVEEVRAFNGLQGRYGERVSIKSSTLSVGFSFAAMKKLRPDDPARCFADSSFGDGADADRRPGRPVVVVIIIIIAADTQDDADPEAKRVIALIEAIGGEEEGPLPARGWRAARQERHGGRCRTAWSWRQH